MIDVRFPTALQILLTLALAESEGMERVSSSQLAKGLDANPSFVRKLLVPLAEAGFIDSTFGRDGGVRLGRRPNEIALDEIYQAVLGPKNLWEPRTVPHRCLVSSNIERYFARLTDEANDAVQRTLREKTLAGVLNDLRKMDAASKGN